MIVFFYGLLIGLITGYVLAIFDNLKKIRFYESETQRMISRQLKFQTGSKIAGGIFKLSIQEEK